MDVVATLRREAGQTLVEVVAAAALLLVIAVTTTTVLISSDQAAGRSSARAGAASLLASEQQRLRSLAAVGSLSDLRTTRTATLPVGGSGTGSRTYTVSSTVAPARDSGDVSCTTDTSTPEYLHSRTSVTWAGGGPLVGDSLISPSAGSVGRDVGTLGVQVLDRNAQPVQGATVTVGGRARTTNELGCVVLSYLPVGSYGISAVRTGAVGPDGASTATTTGTVIAGSTAQQTLTLDTPGDLAVSFTTASPTGVPLASPVAPPTSLSLTNGTSTFTPQPRVVAWSTGKTAVTGLFPFTTAYFAYAGACTANDPATWSVPVANRSSAVVVPGGSSPVAVRMPTVAFKVTGPAGFTANGQVVRLTPTDAGCTGTVAMPATATVNGTGLGAGVTSLALPYGNYAACVASGNFKGTGTVANTSAGGPALRTITVAQQTSAQTC